MFQTVDTSRWFVVPIEGEAGCSFLVCATSKMTALEHFEEYAKRHGADHPLTFDGSRGVQSFDDWYGNVATAFETPLKELNWHIGAVHPDCQPTGYVVLMG
jgi:hypothetical protein